MAKSALRLEAIRLRQLGISVRDIAKKVGVTKSTASRWSRDVILSVEQLETLRGKKLIGGERGRLISALNQKQFRLERESLAKKSGLKLFPSLTTRELLIAGLCLYWAEGSKKSKRISLCNSDPKVILFYIKWLELIYQIPKSELRCELGINEAHREREEVVKEFWSNLTNIPLSSFTKTSFKQYPLRKMYENFNDHYGTLAIKVSKPGRIYTRVLGEIYGLTQALNSPIMAG